MVQDNSSGLRRDFPHSTAAACNSHARRKVFEARHNHPQVASVLLAMYQELYDIEDQARSMDADPRRQLRDEKSTLVWQRMREYLDAAAFFTEE